MSKKRKKKGHSTSLSAHKRHKSKLITPLNALPMTPLNWVDDFLPEHLWLDFLFYTYSQKGLYIEIFNIFIDEIEKYCPDGTVITGYISDFSLVPEEKREDFIKDKESLIYDAFSKPFGRIISFYPEAPCSWLIIPRHIARGGTLDPAVELKKLTDSVSRLMPGKDIYAGHIRVLPFNRLLKHQKIHYIKGNPVLDQVLDLLPKYPVGCSEEEQYRVQQHVRMQMNLHFQMAGRYKDLQWSKYFWRHNYDLVPCNPHAIVMKNKTVISEKNADTLMALLEKNIQIAIDYLYDISQKYRYDIYSPSRDEILLGLFSRITRLYVLFSQDPNLWARDITGILLRCITDTAITFGYLAKCGTGEDFQNFRSYGEGKEKLLMLHLQDTYPDRKSIDGQTSEEIMADLGGAFTPEMIDIELGNWTKKSARDLAIASGLDEIYRLVYDPTSADIHGTWMSLKRSNLLYCVQPLHKYHRLPQYFEPPLYLDTLLSIQKVYQTCIDLGINFMQFPRMRESLHDIAITMRQQAASSSSDDSGAS